MIGTCVILIWWQEYEGEKIDGKPPKNVIKMIWAVP